MKNYLTLRRATLLLALALPSLRWRKLFQKVFLFGAAASFFAVSASAQNLVLNPSFASGFTSWTNHGWGTGTVPSDPGTPPPATTTDATNGCPGAACNNPVTGAWISQTLTTVPGQTYVLSFYYDVGPGSGEVGQTTELETLWNGSPVTGGTIVNAAASTWAQYSFTVVATGTSTVLEFTGRQDPGGLFLTDISVTVPITPATSYTLTGPAGGALNTASGAFTVTPAGGPYTGTITITPSGGGLSTPFVLTFSNSAVAQTFTVTATAAGPVTLTPSNSGSLTNPAALTFATPPAAPTIGTATAGSGSVSVAFSPPGSNGGSAITQYTATCNPGGLSANGTSSPITVTGLAAGTTYTCTVTATNTYGQSAASAASNAATTPGSGYTVTGPAGGLINNVSSIFTITPNAPFTGTITVTLSGGAATAMIAGRSGKIAQAKGGARALVVVRTFNNSAVPQTFTVTPTAVGPVIITTTNSGGLTDPPALSYATQPGPPVVGTATPGAGSVTVTFTEPNTGGPPVTSFTATCTGGFTGTGSSSPVVVSGLPTGSYSCTVTATNAFGISASSAVSNAVSPTLPTTPAPSTLVLISLGVLLLWTRNRYRAYRSSLESKT